MPILLNWHFAFYHSLKDFSCLGSILELTVCVARWVSPDFAMKLGWAAGTVLASSGTKEVLIGKDTRSSGYMLESAMEAGFSAAGVNVALIGPMPTPAVAYLASTFRADAGVVISASHNPFYDNGIKFFLIPALS